MTVIKITVIIIAVSTMFLSCKTFHATQARGEAGIVRISQFEVGNTPDDQGTFLWSYYNANRRGSVMYVKDGKIRVLAENAPDAALQTIAGITAKADVVGKVDAELQYSTAKTIAQLGKRTASVNMLRDALYRLNELYYASLDYEERKIKSDKSTFPGNTNTVNLSKTDFIFLFTAIIDNTRDISLNESQAESGITKSESEADIEKAKAQGKRYETLLAAFEKVEGKLSKEEVEKLLKEYMDRE